MKVLVTGATGFVGRRLLELLPDVVVLSRDVPRAQALFPRARVFPWDPRSAPPPDAAWEGIEGVVHLAGDPVAEGRWTSAKKQAIRESRVLGTTHLVAGMLAGASPPRVLVSASAVGIYGSRGDELLDEQAPPASGFLAEVCAAWERAAQRAESQGVRVVTARIGIVLDRDGGAMAQMLPPFRWGVGGRLGSGRQWMPWIHRDDVVGLLRHALDTPEVSGAMNVVAPQPVTNREFTAIFGRVLGRPACLPAPAWGLRLALGEFAEVLLASQRVVPRLAEQTGYAFRFTDLATALSAVVASPVALKQ